ncbi:MAG: hypothetical protein NTX25_06355 [Proteobacteria bacterium]|nr:hypothetical protein [Pseudomonadota bacterium]
MGIKSWQVIALLIVIFKLGHWCMNYPSSVASGPPLKPGQEPRQEELSRADSKLLKRQDEVSRLRLTHKFDITGEAIAVSSYKWSFKNPYFDVDVGLAWGPRIQEYKDKLRFYQGARWLMWSYRIAASSTRRDDSGDGACEIVWVEELQIGNKIYR